jgi:murein L,D-transpeptidase YafK
VTSPAATPAQGKRVASALWRRLAIGALVFAGAATAVLLGWEAITDWDHIEIEIERSRRAAQTAVGAALPGTPDLADLNGRLATQGLTAGAPVFIRIFKREFELELWLKRDDRFERFAVYPICRWSGRLGPKIVEGDSQAPEGFYTVDSKALNPASRWHRAFNLGFPNAFDRAHQRTGSFVMVHGGCGSIGCYAMTDAVVDEIWRLVTTALKGGQRRFHVHVFPFRMTEENLEKRAGAEWASFWRNLKAGYDAFEESRVPPRVSVCRGRYVVAPAPNGSDGSQEIDSGCINQAHGGI